MVDKSKENDEGQDSPDSPEGEEGDSQHAADLRSVGDFVDGWSEGRDALVLSQDEADDLERAAKGRKPYLLRPDHWTGPRPEIEKSPIEDEGAVEILMGRVAAEQSKDSSADASKTGHLLTQTDVESMILDQTAKQEAADDSLVFEGDRPEILFDPIKDPGMLAVLLGRSAGGLDQSAETAATEKQDADDQPLDQAHLDALIDGLNDAPGTDDASVEVEAADANLDQAQLDAMVAAQSKGLAEGPLETFEGERAEIESEPVEDPEIHSVLMGTAAAPASEELPPAEGDDAGLSQEALDKLLEESAELIETAPAAEATAEIPSAKAEDVAGLGQADIDKLLDDAEPESTPVETASEPISEAGASATLDQDELDLLVAQHETAPSGEATGPSEAPTASSSETLDQTALDQLVEESLQALEKDGGDAVLAGGESEDILDSSNMNERLDASATAVAADEELIEGQSDIDRLVQELADDGETDEPAEAPVKTAPEPHAEPAAKPSKDEEELIGSENIAAAAVVETQEDDGLLSQDVLDQLLDEAKSATPKKESVEEKIEEPEVAEQVVEEVVELSEEEHVERRPLLDPARIPGYRQASTALREDRNRALWSLAAAAVLGLTTLAYLYLNPYKRAPEWDVAESGRGGTVEQTLFYARELIDEARHLEAMELLDGVIKNAPPGVAHSDAQFLRLEAEARSMPQSIEVGAADSLHGRIDALLSTRRAHPAAPKTLFMKGLLYEAESNNIAARSVYRNILSNFPMADNRAEVLMQMGRLAMAEDRPEEGASYFRTILQNHPASTLTPWAKLYLGDALEVAGNTEDSRILYIESAQSASDSRLSDAAFERLGRLALDQGDFKEAIREFETRLETSTSVEGNDGVYLFLARAYHGEGRLEDARELLNELIDFFPESDVTPQAFVELSGVLNDLGLSREAVRLATQTVQRYPEHPLVLRNAGEFLGQSGDAQSAARMLMAADAAGANDPELLLRAGREFAKVDDLAGASRAFKRLVDMFPVTPQALEGRIEAAKVLYEQGEVSNAIRRLEDLSKVSEGTPHRIPVLLALGNIYTELGLMESTREVYSQVGAIAAEPSVLALAAFALFDAKAWDEGLMVASRVELSALDDAKAYKFLTNQGEVLLRGDSRLGLDKMEQAYSSYPSQRTADGVQRLLEANLTLGRSARARSIVMDLLRRVSRPEFAVEQPRLERAAVTWGDFLYSRRDFRAAADAYAIAVGDLNAELDAGGTESTVSPKRQWAMYQGANALFQMQEYDQSLKLLDGLTEMTSDWAQEAGALAATARLELRLRRASNAG